MNRLRWMASHDVLELLRISGRQTKKSKKKVSSAGFPACPTVIKLRWSEIRLHAVL